MSSNEMASANPPPPTTSIYVANLPDECDEESLRSSFASVLKTEIHSINLIHDNFTNKFKNAAYLDVGSYEKVKEAIRLTNGTVLKGKRILVSMALRPFVNSSEKRVYLKNVPAECDTIQLYDLLSNYGELASLRLTYDESAKKHLGYAFATYLAEESAQEAIRAINDMATAEDSLRAEHYEPPNERNRNWRTVYVKSFPKSWTTEDLRKAFSQIGQIESVYIHTINGASQGFGTVSFRKHEDALAAVAMNGKAVKSGDDEAVLYISKHQTKQERTAFLSRQYVQMSQELCNQTKDRNLVVRNLTPYITSKSLIALFKPYGDVESVKITPHPKDPDLCSGLGFVVMETVEGASKAIHGLRGFILDGREVKVEAFKSRAEREAEKAPRPGQPPLPPPPRLVHLASTADGLFRELRLDTFASDSERKQVIGNYMYARFRRFYSRNPGLLQQVIGVILGSLDIAELLEVAVNEEQFASYAKEAKSMVTASQTHSS